MSELIESPKGEFAPDVEMRRMQVLRALQNIEETPSHDQPA
jgi:hypothetical protein